MTASPLQQQPCCSNHGLQALTPSSSSISHVVNFSHHHHHVSVMELGHLLARSGLTYPEVSSKICHDSFCQSVNSVSLPWIIYCEAFFLHGVSTSSCIPIICAKFVLFLTPLKFVYLFCNLSKCILLFSFSYCIF